MDDTEAKGTETFLGSTLVQVDPHKDVRHDSWLEDVWKFGFTAAPMSPAYLMKTINTHT